MEHNELCTKVLIACRTELCQLFPALNTAFAMLPFRVGGNAPFSTDGMYFYTSNRVLELFSREPAALRRGYLHVLLHCLYLHIDPPKQTDFALWSTACDIYAEHLIHSLAEERLETVGPIREDCLRILGSGEQTPQTLMKLLDSGFFPYPLQEIAGAFRFDDHSLWLGQKSEGLRKKWEGAMPGGGEIGQGNRGSKSSMEEEEISVLDAKPYDFRRYLRKYMVTGEELETDQESFDYIYYNFGMAHYGNLPLLEPLEYREVWRMRELVIAIDTSGSCSRELVTRFLRETYGILSTRENFFRKMRVVFFQCDCVLQDTAVIRSPEQWENYSAKLKIRGRGGTDFRPVFREVEKLRAAGTLKCPRALLYFTDGDGIYPSEPPDYETVFVLADSKKRPDLVPKWAKKLILE